ncbi:hypothetical protein SAMN05444397_1192 [Flavobacterium aquidurense]|uniref:Uncharacterized protein n=1 Tax=Flavobacterium frigidimaris TaxID=262320 RepID=A0ABX4BL34_FLAFR|nr:hypothetical protein [Flavobacterium frigidimaris]OXA75861.1 hypothetical protein B0A65_20530 [Flavobacterium frigidimaris]SDZ67130.1 hypothetical protein SAMN05444397_1192 [Flavobacterium aquidurense]
MNKSLLLIITLFHSFLQSQTFNGNLGSQSLNWNTDQKVFNTIPRDGIAPMSIKLWDNYNGINAPSQYGTLLEINGRVSHLDSQLYFAGSGDNGRILYRSAFYGQTTWQDWQYLLDSKNDIETMGNLKITGNSNSYILNGNIGIGTTAPTYKLDVIGDIAFLYGRAIYSKGYAFSKVLESTYNGTNDVIYLYTAGAAPTNAIPKMTLLSNGNVGIGTTNPTSKLTVAGNINSREVKVTVDAGADFVFEKDYELPSLDSVDRYIKENKHLPEVASANEMKKDGINLSEMNIKLLQKIEELTLYMIEIKKENEKMKYDIIKLKEHK